MTAQRNPWEASRPYRLRKLLAIFQDWEKRREELAAEIATMQATYLRAGLVTSAEPALAWERLSPTERAGLLAIVEYLFCEALEPRDDI